MDDYFRKSKRRPSLAHRTFPTRGAPVRPVPRAHVPPIPTPQQSQRTTRAPRKRFRKKVTGLFGDQTDLQKRMKKLLREWPSDILTRKPTRGHFTDTSPVHSLQTSDELVQTVVKKIDILKSGAETAREIKLKQNELETDNGDKDTMTDIDRNDPTKEGGTEQTTGKWRMFQSKIGRLSPRSNDMFLDELDVGTPSPESVRTMTRIRFNDKEIEPPTLPPLENVLVDGQKTPFLRTQSLDRTATPAMLRRKVRRNERGYRGADVLRMRLSQVGETPNDGARLVYTREEGNPSPKTNTDAGQGQARGTAAETSPARRRTRSELAGLAKRPTLKRRRVASDADKYPSNVALRDHDPFALLIEAAEKESGEAQRMADETAQDQSGCAG